MPFQDVAAERAILAGVCRYGIDAYYDVISERGGEHQLVQVSDLNDRLADVYEEEYVQDVPTIVKHYGPSILGKEAWKYKQGKIKIGQFK